MNLIVLIVSVMNFARVWKLKSLYSLYSSAGAFVYLNATAALLGAEYRSFLKIFVTTSELLSDTNTTTIRDNRLLIKFCKYSASLLF